MAFAVGSGIKGATQNLKLSSFNIYFDESLQKILPILCVQAIFFVKLLVK